MKAAFHDDLLEKKIKIDSTVHHLLSRYAAILKENFKEKLLSAAIFGSIARGAAKFPGSDIDVLIVMSGAEKLSFGERFKLIRDAEEKLSETDEYAKFRSAFGSRPNIQEIIFAPDELKTHPPVLLDLTTDVIILHDTGILMEEINKLNKKLAELGAKRVQRKDSWFWILKPEVKLGETVEL